eukprot:contig_17252_g4202
MIPKAAVQVAVDTQADEWVVDSGATHHLATDKADFSAMASVDDTITTASDGTLSADSRGVATLPAEGADNTTVITLKNTYRVPGFKDNLMSVGQVDASGGAVLFAHRRCFVFDDADIVAPPEVTNNSDAQGNLKANGQYTLGVQGIVKQAKMASAPVSGTASIWHSRYFHLGYGNLQRVAKMVNGMPAVEVTPERVTGAIC